MLNSAGILIYRLMPETQVLLGHPGGPFWKKKDLGAWSIPKGELDPDEEMLTAAIRELKEETNLDVAGEFFELRPIRMKSGKRVFAWAINAEPDLSEFKSNTFELSWPPKSGKIQLVPELDKIEWLSLDAAREKILPAQVPFLDQLESFLRK